MLTVNAVPNRLLLIDPDAAHAKALKDALALASDCPSDFEWLRTLEGAERSLRQRNAWVIFLNLFLPDSRGVSTFRKVRLLAPVTPVVVLAGSRDEEFCGEVVRQGTHDYVLEGRADSRLFARALGHFAGGMAHQDLFPEKELAQLALNSIGDAVATTDLWGRVTYMNPVAEQMSGWTRHQAMGRPFTEIFMIFDAATHKASINPLRLAIEENRTVGLTTSRILVRRDGYEAYIEDSAAPLHDRQSRVAGAVIVFRDVSLARSMALEMSHRAQHDVLTDLPNRLLFNDRLKQSISLARRNQHQLAVLFLDLDNFKNINDSQGHALGDQLLQSVTSRLLACVRKSDTVSRQGGDEFVVLLSELTRASDAAVCAAKILTELKKEHAVGQHRLRITASIGIGAYPNNGEDAETLIKNADTAMYHAKQRGRDNYQFFHPEMSLQAVERQSLEGQLRYALERRELLLHYQPKINLKTGAITSAEALLRWQHPERGLLLPAQFLTIAEDTGLIVGIGQWVLREACRQTREWLDAGVRAVPVAINISSLEFRSDQFLEGVRLALKQMRLDPRYLELELTETVLMRHAESTAYALAQLKSLGVRLAVDDFGTGYSSLSYLTRFPIDTLKLDQSFVRDIFAATHNDAIVLSAVIGMGKNLQHTVVAEGVETAEQLAFLQARECDEGQGFYFSRPVMPGQFVRLLQTGIMAVAI